MKIRPSVTIGQYSLSVQASAGHSCHPQTDGLDISDYSHVEVSVSRGKTKIAPSDIPGLAPVWTCYFEPDNVARSMAAEQARALRAELHRIEGVDDETVEPVAVEPVAVEPVAVEPPIAIDSQPAPENLSATA